MMFENFSEDLIKEIFQESGILDSVDQWIRDNPRPENFEGGSYAWAWTEMPLSWSQRNKVKNVKTEIFKR